MSSYISGLCSAIVVTAQILSSQLEGFKCRVLEGSSDILSGASLLRRGHFPKKTPVNEQIPFEAGLLIWWDQLLGTKKIHIPISDTSGEVIQESIIGTRGHMNPNPEMWGRLTTVGKYILNCDGVILVAPASRALMFQDDVQLEAEPTSIDYDPDVNLARILNTILDHKDRNRQKLKGLSVLITKWDLIAPYAANWGMDLYDPTGQGLKQFMEVCFPATSMALKSYGLDNVQFFPSHIQVKRKANGNLEKWPDGSDKIERIEEKRVPKYSESSYVALINWLKGFAG